MIEANGQSAYIPLMVDPLSLTLRRCRDGVFALLSDTEGLQGIDDAFIYGKSWDENRETMKVQGSTTTKLALVPDARTDKQGAAFAKVYGGGDRAILAWDAKSGRYAVGGFGDLFEGLYISKFDKILTSRYDRYHRRGLSVLYERDEYYSNTAHRYEDDSIVAAYTDRPTYRPGQSVKFKLIVRQLLKDLEASVNKKPSEQRFRAEDFELATAFKVPEKDHREVSLQVINPKGQVIARMDLDLNDFGTAVGKMKLSDESPTGTYTLKLSVGDVDRVVPSFFSVKYYRRANFELNFLDAPKQIFTGQELQLGMSAKYYFGKALSSGEVELCLVKAGQWHSLASTKGALDREGEVSLHLEIPESLSAGEYQLLASLTDESGRTVSQSARVVVEKNKNEEEGAKKWGLKQLPRFLAVDEVVKIHLNEDSLKAYFYRDSLVFYPNANQQFEIKISTPGWWTLETETEGEGMEERREIFIYGGYQHPLDDGLGDPWHRSGEEDPNLKPTWVNLTDYQGEELYENFWLDYWREGRRRSEEKLMVLFGSQQVNVGGKLKLLAYIPYEEARLLFTFEGRTVVNYHITNTTSRGSAYHVIEIPIGERALPNFYLGGRILSKKNPFDILERLRTERARLERQEKTFEEMIEGSEDPRWCRIDVFGPNRPEGEEKLKISISTLKKSHKPGEKVQLEMKVLGLDGQPKKAEVSLSVVDESVYSFGEDRLDDLKNIFVATRGDRRYRRKTWRSFLANRWTSGNAFLLEVMFRARVDYKMEMRDMMKMAKAQIASEALEETSDKNTELGLTSYNAANELSLSRAELAKFGALPVGEVPLARLRKDFRETAAWLPQLYSDEKGEIKTSFVLPDSMTSYRLTAVGLTQATEIGVSRKSIGVSLPLAVQLFMPRFAVEGDRLTMVAMVHNRTEQVKDCTLRWRVEGAEVVYKNKSPQKQGEMAGNVVVPARGSASVKLELLFNRVGETKVTVTTNADKNSDGETRKITVQALGRRMDINLNGELIEGKKTLDLPENFTVQKMHVTLSQKNMKSAMSGLGYLVDYPYGCVEQTMSRFLPAVMVARAASKGSVILPKNVAEKLPKVLEKGLERLYNFQHKDGGWGWWKEDATNLRMSVYTVYGLARCQSVGTRVNYRVLSDGCNFLRKMLKAGKFEEENKKAGEKLGVSDLCARAWLALALAKRANKREFSEYLNRVIKSDIKPESLCNLALACQAMGLNDLGESLWERVKNWPAKKTSELALYLSTQLAYEAPLKECSVTGTKILDRRKGHRWENTRSTAWAIEALSTWMPRLGSQKPAKKIKIKLDEFVLFDSQEKKASPKIFFDAHFDLKQLSKKRVSQVHLLAEFEEAGLFTLSLHGHQILEKILPTGSAIRLTREYLTLKGEPIVGAVKVGDVLAVHLKLKLKSDQDYLMMDEPRPAALEFAGEELSGSLSRQVTHREFRDDRLNVFFQHLSKGEHELVYYLRAETLGLSHVLPGRAYPMYKESVVGETGSDLMEVK